MIVNDVMQQAQCEQPLEKVTKVGVERLLSSSASSQAGGGAEPSLAFLLWLKPTFTLVNVQTSRA